MDLAVLGRPSLGQIPETLRTWLTSAASPEVSGVLYVLKNFLGMDVSGFRILLVLIGLLRFGSLIGSKVFDALCLVSVRSVTIDNNTHLFDDVMAWLLKGAFAARLSDLTGTIDNPKTAQLDAVLGKTEARRANFKSWEASEVLEYEIAPGSYWFFQAGRPFLAQLIVLKEANRNWMGDPASYQLTISTIGFSVQPVQHFLELCSKQAWDRDASQTAIYRADRDVWKFWRRVAVRPNRPLKTVVLDNTVKERLLDDMNEYLRPASRRWYSARGIPYRRGYLFYGPPGTGKTSFAYAIAGEFGLDIRCCSLAEGGMTDDFLTSCFDHLPDYCVVLLEDIDVAGLGKRRMLKNRKKGGKSEERSKKPPNRKPAEKDDSSLVTLSGLLNVIDGVCSAQGRILIMTSNSVDDLDPALLRPGRVDLKVEFGMTTRNELVDIFKNVYNPDSAHSQDTSDTKQAHPLQVSEGPSAALDLEELARFFAQGLPDRKLTAAQVQGFLLERKKAPVKAVHEVEVLAHMADKVKEEEQLEDNEGTETGEDGEDGHEKEQGGSVEH